MSNLFFVFAFISVGVGIVSSILVTSYVSHRGIKINYFLWRIMIFKYVNDYRRITKQETGKTGPWFYVLAVAMNLALVFVIIGIIVR
jgi:hypothetical protein